MKILIRREPAKTVLRWTHRILLACAVVLLTYCVYFEADGWYYQRQEQAHLNQLLRAGAARPPSPDTRISPPNAVLAPLAEGSLIGRLEIPRLHLSVIVLEGAEENVLSKAAGHIPETGFPGNPGANIGISAHRDTFFRPLQNIQKKDLIKVTTPAGEYRYRVVWLKIVKPEDVEVLDPDPGGTEVLTLVTCYPFYYVGSAPDRFVVRAERLKENATVSGR